MLWSRHLWNRRRLNLISVRSRWKMWNKNIKAGYWVFLSYSTWCDGHPIAVDNWALLFLLLRRLQAGALLHVADWLVPLPLALGTGPGSGQQGFTHIQRRSCGRRLRWRFRCAVKVIWGQRRTAPFVLEATCTAKEESQWCNTLSVRHSAGQLLLCNWGFEQIIPFQN